MEIYLIRHAQSTNQVLDDRANIVFDPHLTELGERQAASLAHYFAPGEERIRLADPGVDRLICSPMWRAMQTARPLAEVLDLNAEIWIDVHEQILTTAHHTGSTRAEILAAFPDYHVPDEIGDRGWWNGHGETRSGCMERAIRVAGRLRKLAEVDRTLAIVSHARFIDALLKAFLDHLPGYGCWYHHNNTGVSLLGVTEERLWIRYLNRLAHLSPELVS